MPLNSADVFELGIEVNYGGLIGIRVKSNLGKELIRTSLMPEVLI